MTGMIILALLTTSAFYLGSRAVVTEFLWSRYPVRFARFMDCAACSGAWYGGIAGAVLGPNLDLPPILTVYYGPALIGLCSVVWTPILAGVMQRGFEQLGSVIPPE
jgi:hypothetical protein